MLRKSVLLVTAWIGLLSNVAFSYDWLYVQHPRQTWRAGQGTIEEAALSIKPEGLYVEYGLYLTFSGRGLGFTAQDSVEVQFFFDLPQQAIVHDLWLWVNEDIVRALITDRWTASAIYEDIVKRRRDPAILFKNDDENYELRIYPMEGNKTRKIKLTYLMPVEWRPSSVAAAMPMNLLLTSRTKPKLELLYWPVEGWNTPRIAQFPGVNFFAGEDTAMGPFKYTALQSTQIQTPVSFELDSPMRDGIFINRFKDDSQGWYQLAVLPSEALDLRKPRKAAFLFDHTPNTSSVGKAEVLSSVKSMLHQYFADTDSFNLIFSQLNIRRASDRWIPADSASIENTFTLMGQDPITNYSNLPTLLSNAIDFVKANGSSGSLVLIASNTQFGDYRSANPLVNDLLAKMNPIFPIHVADYVTNANYYYFNSRSYFGNEYFYENLTRRTNGSYIRIQSTGTFSALISGVNQALGGFLESFDFHTTLENGFCFGRFNLNNSNRVTHLDQPILEIGKYNGEFPFIIEASGLYENEPFSRTITLSDANVAAADSLAEEIWTGNYISWMESQPQSNEVVKEILDISIRERVLSRYSAFLALEPSDTVKVCLSCIDETEIIPPTSVEERNDAAADSLLQAFPNPFNIATKIRLTLPANLKDGEASLRVYNMMGQVVKTFEMPTAGEKRTYEFTWDGRNDTGEIVATGTYFVVFKTAMKRQTLKLLMVK